MIILLYIALYFLVVGGALIDARMWGDKKEDKPWLVRYTDIIWLANWGIFTPWMWMFVGAILGLAVITNPLFILKFFVAAFGMSVFWDATFFKMESNVWLRPIRCWAALPWFGVNRVYNRFLSVENKLLVIGFNSNKDMMLFNCIRVVVLIGSILI